MGVLTGLFRTHAMSPAEAARDPVSWMFESDEHARETAAGVAVTPENSLTVSSVFAAVRAIAEDVAKLPCIVYRRVELDGGEGKQRATDEPIYQLLRTEPNPEMGAFDFRQAITAAAVLWGNGYAEIERNGAGTAAALWPIEPWRVASKRDDAGSLFYEIEDEETNDSRTIRTRNMIKVSGISVNGLVGWMMARVGQETIGLAMASMRFTASFFAHGATPSGVVTLDGKMDPEKLRHYTEQINQRYAGFPNHHKLLAFDQGAQFNSTSVDPEKSQLIESIQFSVEDVARYFRVPPHKIQHLLRATFSNVEQQSLEYVGDTMMPWIVRWEQELTRKLLPREGSLFVELLVDALLRADMSTRYQVYATAIQNGIMHRNEARSKENMDPYPGGDRYLIQQNMAVINDEGVPEPASDGEGSVSDEPTPGPEPVEDEDGSDDTEALKASMMPVFYDAAERVIQREAKALQSKASNSESEIREWMVGFYEKHRNYVADTLSPVCSSMAKLCGGDGAKVARYYAEEHVEESQRNIRECVEAGDSLDELIEDWRTNRAPWMAQHLTDEVAK